ncbi:MAG: transcriptional regulator, partial [Azospira oryzae]
AQLARERGRPAADGWLEVAATQQELALLAHLSRQTVNELMQAERVAGRLRLGRGRWWCRLQ